MMREAAEAWLEDGRQGWKPTTYGTYRQIIDKYIVPFLGNMKIDRITDRTLDGFRVQINSGSKGALSVNYQFYICSLVRRILLYMKTRYNRDIQLPILPVAHNKKGRIEPPGEKVLAVLENYLLKNIEEDTCIGIIIALYTGIRIGELCALTWEDIDWEEGVLRIKKKYPENAGSGSTARQDEQDKSHLIGSKDGRFHAHYPDAADDIRFASKTKGKIRIYYLWKEKCMGRHPYIAVSL